MDGYLSLLAWGQAGWGDDLFWGIVTTLKVSLSAYGIALAFGALCAIGKQSPLRPVRFVAGVYTTVVRALPELLVILLLYFSIASGIERAVKALGLAGDSFQVSPFWAAVVALAFVSGAFMAEVMRAAYLAVPLGQIEAGLALGMHRSLILVRVVLPQMIRHAIPGMGNLWLEMTKESAIISVLGAFNDLLYVGYRAAAGTRQYIFFYGLTAVLFLMITAVSVYVIARLERRFFAGLPLMEAFANVARFLPPLIAAMPLTLILTVTGVVLGLLIGTATAVAMVYGRGAVAWPAKAFTFAFRGTPLLVQLYLIYYGLGQVLPATFIRHSFLWPYLRDGLWYAVFALSLNQAAYNAEVIRGAMLAVPKGQIEAAISVGMRPFTILRRITLPQALRLCLPVLTSDVIILLKSTSLASTITIMEMMGTARMLQRQTLLVFEPLIAAGLLYFAVVVVLTRVMAVVERRLTLYRQPARSEQG